MGPQTTDWLHLHLGQLEALKPQNLEVGLRTGGARVSEDLAQPNKATVTGKMMIDRQITMLFDTVQLHGSV
jgi:hypothetical protein